MAKINTVFANATKMSTTAPKISNTPSVTGTGSVYLSVRDLVLQAYAAFEHEQAAEAAS